MKKIILLFGLIVIILSCNTTEPLPPGTGITLKTEDVSSIETWIKIITNNIQLPTTVTLKKNNTVEQTISLLTQDSVIYIDSLLPKTTYTFQAFIQSSNQSFKSNELSVTTMDTTSHNFTWQTFTFGEHSSSVLNDVAIIDENNIWAVGEIYMNDSLGNPDPTFYNAAHWNGQEWKLKRILYSGGIWTIKTIFAFNANDIWFSAFVRYDGQNFIELPIPPILTGWTINKIWGTSSNDLYIVGNNGNIARWDGTRWIKLFDNGTDLNINDIWGDYDDDTNQWEILAVASNVYQGPEREILEIFKDHRVTKLKCDDLNWTLSGVWFISQRKYFVVGSGIYEKHKLSDNKWDHGPFDITSYYIFKLRGNNVNDLIGVGGVGEVVHFNGASWHSYFNTTKLNYGNYYGVAAKGDIVVVVGEDNPKAVITVGKR